MSFLEISPEMFFALLPLPCLRGLKSLMSMTTAALHRLPAMTNLLHVGKWFYSDFFGNLHSRFLIKSPCRAPPPPLSPKKLKRLVCRCAGCHHQQDVNRGRGCYTLASFHLGSIITGFPRGLHSMRWTSTSRTALRSSNEGCWKN